jgi:uncharacterized MnhB-related membrane protein
MTQFFDGLLVLLLVWLAWRAVTDRDLLRATVKFIVLGLMLAMIWMRLGALDVALAEAAVGSGITGALLLVALRRQSGGKSESMKENEEDLP